MDLQFVIERSVLSKSSAINRLSAARFFLFGSRDIWFVVALPVWFVGIATSKVTPLGPTYIQEGQSILYWLLKRVIAGPNDTLEVLDGRPIINGWMVPRCDVGTFDMGGLSEACTSSTSSSSRARRTSRSI